jgi:hypothetical protein
MTTHYICRAADERLAKRACSEARLGKKGLSERRENESYSI